MPLGLKNILATFQLMMDTALQGIVGNNCFVYFDDIIIFGSTIQGHNRNLAIILDRFTRQLLFIKNLFKKFIF